MSYVKKYETKFKTMKGIKNFLEIHKETWISVSFIFWEECLYI